MQLPATHLSVDTQIAGQAPPDTSSQWANKGIYSYIKVFHEYFQA